MEEQEVWRDVLGFEELYKISDKGQLYRFEYKSSVVNQVKFYSKDKTKYSIMTEAGGFVWKKVDVTEEEFKLLLL